MKYELKPESPISKAISDVDFRIERLDLENASDELWDDFIKVNYITRLFFVSKFKVR